ncbi:TPR-like protein [Gonapodya prolifera JEL478]|uniref:TPR-like protein n=1 Tax=Gonapodya prolifera (strain JEL478) TaxID=1344416 RepID=A0A138ZZD7_GONPJ|nr:TPR-like protein [Gonapodya prolifera JEL478]|eukprot:KXS09778.1 TPR-like protein [Gonapodya prolifera JEL478]
MMLSRVKPAISSDTSNAQTAAPDPKRNLPQLESFIENRDYIGALTLLDFSRSNGDSSVENILWTAYAAFHLGDYKRAMEVTIRHHDVDSLVHLYLACTYFFLGMYKEADEAAKKSPTNKLQNRLFFHLSHKFNDEKRLMHHHQSLQDVVEDQMTLSSVHYLRGHYQEAVDIYKRLLLERPECVAANAYAALCYYKLDYYDVSQEVLGAYLAKFPDSVTAANLRACNHYRLYNAKAAEQELTNLRENIGGGFKFAEDLIRHNLVVFRNGEGALQVFPALTDVLPEARLNLVIHHLRADDTQAGYTLMKDVEPATPQEYILKGIANAVLGQESDSREHLKVAQQYFQLVGGSASECDTIPGRQCMASCFFLLRQFDDVLTYLNSIKAYFYNDDTFNLNYGQAKVAVGAYEEAEEALCLVQNEKLKSTYTYLSHLARCFIQNKKPRLAWELYLKMETSSESFSLLQLIAHDCYKTAQYFYSAKAFDVLERLDPSTENWEGKRGACVGVFQAIVNGTEPKETLRDVLTLLRSTSNPAAEYIVRIVRRWAKEREKEGNHH